MLAKLALRNVKRQMSSYLIYFITVTLTVAMMFAFCNLVFSDVVTDYAEKLHELSQGLIILSVCVALIVAFVLGYASSFMLKLRKREFGTYLTLGMTRGNILLLFSVESLIIGVVALGIGILLGLVLFQGMVGIVAHIMDIKVFLGVYSIKGFYLTVILTSAMFLLSTVISAIYLRKATIYELINGSRRVDRVIKHPVIWMAITVISFLALVGGFYVAGKAIFSTFKPGFNETTASSAFMIGIVVVAVSVVSYHIGLAKSLVVILLKNRNIKSRGTNTFMLRQMSGQMGANSVLCGMLAFLVAMSIIGVNVSFAEKAMIDHYFDHNLPFDIIADLTTINSSPYSYEEAKDIINQHSQIESTTPYTIYTTGNGYLHEFTPWTGAGYEDLFDSFISESDFNNLISNLGYKKISLDKRFLIISNIAMLKECDFSKAELEFGGNKYSYGGIDCDYPVLAGSYFICVIPDEVVSSMEEEERFEAIDLKNGRYDAEGLYKRLCYTVKTKSGYEIERCNFKIREYYRLEENSMAAVLIIGALYISMVFIFLAIAILTMKLLSGISDDRKRYELLYRLGVSRREQDKTLLRQLSVFFTMPFILPIIMSIPVAFICGRIMKLAGYRTLVSQIYLNSSVIALVLVIIQLVYFASAYHIEKRSVLH